MDWALLVHAARASWLLEISWFLGPARVASRHTHLQAVCYERSLPLPPKLKTAGRLGWLTTLSLSQEHFTTSWHTGKHTEAISCV